MMNSLFHKFKPDTTLFRFTKDRHPKFSRIAFAPARSTMIFLLAIGLSTASAQAQPETLAETIPPPLAVAVGDSWKGVFSPGRHLYPAYLAGPLNPTNGLNIATYTHSPIPEAGDQRFILRVGARVGLFRWFPENHPDQGFQLNLHGGFLGMFDIDNSLDNIGWDGLYGLDLSWRGQSGIALKLGVNHDSSHIGDEYVERTGTLRNKYTRQEYALGVSIPLLEHLRFYTEAGYAFDLRNDELQSEWRLQGGLEFKKPHVFRNGHMGYYAAADINAFEESDWEPDITVQGGLIVPVDRLSRDFRFGLEYRNGRCLIGEFSRYEETYFLLGFWIDL